MPYLQWVDKPHESVNFDQKISHFGRALGCCQSISWWFYRISLFFFPGHCFFAIALLAGVPIIPFKGILVYFSDIFTCIKNRFLKSVMPNWWKKSPLVLWITWVTKAIMKLVLGVIYKIIVAYFCRLCGSEMRKKYVDLQDNLYHHAPTLCWHARKLQ